MRLDQLMVERGLARSRAAAREAILRGVVTVAGEPAKKPGQAVSADAAVETEPDPFASRAGHKLAHALDHFGLDVTGRRALDVGASTGGFTDVLLRRGATKVIALDVAQGQLRPELAADPRVVVLDRVNARALRREDLPYPPTLIVCDVSFISLGLVLPPVLATAEGATLVALMKPQFEVGRDAVGKNGIVTSETAVEAAKAKLAGVIDAAGLALIGWTPSPIAGGDGNREWLFAAVPK